MAAAAYGTTRVEGLVSSRACFDLERIVAMAFHCGTAGHHATLDFSMRRPRPFLLHYSTHQIKARQVHGEFLGEFHRGRVCGDRPMHQASHDSLLIGNLMSDVLEIFTMWFEDLGSSEA